MAAQLNDPTTAAALQKLQRAYGADWSFDIVSHQRFGRTVEVVGELRANGSKARETGTANGDDGQSLGAQLELAADRSLCKCAASLLERDVAPGTPTTSAPEPAQRPPPTAQ